MKFFVAIILRLNHRCVQVEDSENLLDHFIQKLRLLFCLIVVSFSFSNITMTESEQARAISSLIRLIWTTYSHVLSKSQWSKVHYLDHSLLAQLYIMTVKMKTISVNITVNVKMRRWGFTINLYLTAIDPHILSVLIMILPVIQKNTARFCHSGIIHTMVVSMLEWCFHVSYIDENCSATINDMWGNQIASLSTVSGYMIVWKNMNLSGHLSWTKTHINRTNWKRGSSFLTMNTDNMIEVRAWLVVDNRSMIKSEKSSWTRRSWNHLRSRSCCEISSMQCSYRQKKIKSKRL